MFTDDDPDTFSALEALRTAPTRRSPTECVRHLDRLDAIRAFDLRPVAPRGVPPMVIERLARVARQGKPSAIVALQELRRTATIAEWTQVSEGFRVDQFDLAHLGVGRGAPFEMSLFHIEPKCESIPEDHEDAELWLVAAGMGRMVYADTVFEIGSGSVVFIAPGIVHKVINIGVVPLQVYSLWWMPDDKDHA